MFKHWNVLANFVAKFAPNFRAWKRSWQVCNELGTRALKSDLKSAISKRCCFQHRHHPKIGKTNFGGIFHHSEILCFFLYVLDRFIDRSHRSKNWIRLYFKLFTINFKTSANNITIKNDIKYYFKHEQGCFIRYKRRERSSGEFIGEEWAHPMSSINHLMHEFIKFL